MSVAIAQALCGHMIYASPVELRGDLHLKNPHTHRHTQTRMENRRAIFVFSHGIQ